MHITVIIPIYNAAKFLDKCIQSALNQKQTSEILLIDDRSTDGSWEICEMWMKKDDRVRIFKNDGIKGAGAARNIGLRNATCEYIAFLDADDYYLEGRFDETERLFNQNLEIDGTAESTLVSFVNEENSTVISGNFKFEELMGCKENNIEISPSMFLMHTNLLITGITLKRLAIKNYYFDADLKQTQDTDFMLSIIRHKRIFSGIYNKPVVAYYFHENNTTKNFYEAAYYRHQFYRKHLRLYLMGYYPISLFPYFFTRYVEYTYLTIIPKPVVSKRITKMIYMPIFIYYLFSKNVLQFDKNQTILQI